ELSGLRVVSASARADAYIEDVSTLVSRIGDVADWDALVLSVEMDQRVLVVGRSRTSALAIDAALAPLGGGGHPQAASAIVRGGDCETVLERALAEIERVAKPPVRAADVMSCPVHSVSSAADISS